MNVETCFKSLICLEQILLQSFNTCFWLFLQPFLSRKIFSYLSNFLQLIKKNLVVTIHFNPLSILKGPFLWGRGGRGTVNV